jgi:uncharacterized membrane protein
MTWEQRYRLRHATSTSLVLWAGLSLLAALIAAPIIRWLDRETGWVIFGFSPDGARAILGALTGSMLTFIVFVLSATLIVVQLASGQLTPRIIGLVFAQSWMKATLAIFTFSYAYTLSALGRVEGRVPDLHVSVAVLLNLACILVFFYFVQRLSSGVRPSTMMRLVADHGRRVIEQVYPDEYDPKQSPLVTRDEHPSSAVYVVEFEGRTGVVMAFSVVELVRLAREMNAVVVLLPQVGDPLSPGDQLFRVHGGTQPISGNTLRGCVAVGLERTLEQDPRFAFRILVDIANKALSPAVNDPTTAVMALDQIDHLLLHVGRRRLSDSRAHDREGNLRVVYDTPDWPNYVALAVSEIRRFGEGSMQVGRRLRAMLEHLIRELPEDRWPPLQEELALLESGVKRGFRDEADRKRATVADQQGVGASES